MMEDYTTEEILKYGGHKEDDTAPKVALWDSTFLRIWKYDRAMVHPLAGNRQYLLGIFRNFSLWWRKRRQLRSWIAFGKRCQRSSNINHR